MMQRGAASTLESLEVPRELLASWSALTQAESTSQLLDALRDVLVDCGVTRFGIYLRSGNSDHFQLLSAAAMKIAPEVKLHAAQLPLGTLALRTPRRCVGFVVLGTASGVTPLLESVAAVAALALENLRLSEEMERARATAETAGQLGVVGTLAAGIVHEIRNPLVSVQTFFQLAPQRLHEEDFRVTFMQLAHEELKRVCELVSELLDVARPTRRERQPTDLNDIVERTVRLLQPRARQRNVLLDCALQSPAPFAHVDDGQIKQVLINLALNAIDVTPAEGVVLITSSTAKHAGVDWAVLEVIDTGPGIDEKVMPRLFEPFVTTKPGGTGLGLPIAARIVRDHGGEILVDTEPGQGTRFSVQLPLLQ